ncbi:hypothetical protein QR680_014691 [Steinernema hermaphroditum]|uniref:Uncharacterized protein n=1 Tax=Steinernema hermaphroditum TaxID=289476 RepID=A0AA39M4Q3_9BILA|nr:hypothetical protein QR680_014691 [Steinernema hermaphroditum]
MQLLCLLLIPLFILATQVSCRIRFSHLGSHYDGTFSKAVSVARTGECTLLAFNKKKIGFRIKVHEEKKTCALLTAFKRFTAPNDTKIRDYILTTSTSNQVCKPYSARNVSEFISGPCKRYRWDCELLEKMRDYCIFVGSDKPDCISSTGVSIEDVECPTGENLAAEQSGKALCCPKKKVFKEVLNDTAICCGPNDNYQQGTGLCCPSDLVHSKSSSGSIGCCPIGRAYVKTVNGVVHCCTVTHPKAVAAEDGYASCCPASYNKLREQRNWVSRQKGTERQKLLYKRTPFVGNIIIVFTMNTAFCLLLLIGCAYACGPLNKIDDVPNPNAGSSTTAPETSTAPESTTTAVESTTTAVESTTTAGGSDKPIAEQITDAETAKSDAQRAVNDAGAAVTELTGKVDQGKAKYEEDKSKLVTVGKKENALQAKAESDAAAKAEEKAKETKAEAETELSKANEKKTEVEADAAATEEQKKDAQNAVDEAQGKVDKATTALTGAEAAASTKKQEFENVKGDLADGDTVDTVKAEKDTLEADIKAHEAQKDALAEAVEAKAKAEEKLEKASEKLVELKNTQQQEQQDQDQDQQQ